MTAHPLRAAAEFVIVDELLALRAFVDVWGHGELLVDIGQQMTCREADVLADLLRVCGRDGAADTLIDVHRATDEEGDTHYKATCDAEALHGTGTGACDAVLDEHGNCPNASRHVETTRSL